MVGRTTLKLSKVNKADEKMEVHELAGVNVITYSVFPPEKVFRGQTVTIRGKVSKVSDSYN